MICRLALLISTVLTTSCSFGFGSPYVGQWRAHEAVEFEVCVEDKNGECEERARVTTHKPARKFWGVAMSYPMIGIAFPSIAGETQTAFRMDANVEYLRGKGRYAFGVRASAVIDLNSSLFFTTPMMAMGHVGLSERLSFYGGAGFSPFARYRPDHDGGNVSFTSHALGRVLGGLQVVGSRSQRDARLLYSLEADSMISSLGGMSYRSWGFTLSVGIFL